MKDKFISRYFHQAAEKILPHIPDWITGKTDLMQLKYKSKYGQKDCSRIIHQKKLKALTTYLVICAVFFMCVIFVAAGGFLQNNVLKVVERPDLEQDTRTIPAEVKMNYGGNEIKKSINIKVSRRQMTEKEKVKTLQNYKAELKSLIIGDNEDLNNVKSPLSLVNQDINTGITIVWSSDKPEIINEKGEVDLVKAAKGEIVQLNAILTLGEYSEKQLYKVKISKNIGETDYKKNLSVRLDGYLKELYDSAGTRKVVLPNDLGDGIAIQWEKENKVDLKMLTALFSFAIVITYFRRYEQIDKELKDTTESIAYDLPDFINKMVLLLNAGLVVSTAIDKIAEDFERSYENIHNANSSKNGLRIQRRYLYEELCEIKKKVNQSNTPMIKELSEFAQRSGVREFVRMTTIISDNLNKGSSLAEKLETESELLWIGRKKMAEEKGRLAETKLTFPLVILLMVLIMVTIAPAMIEM